VAFDWREFLVLAKSLASHPEESAQRSAISRAYFAAFGHAFDFALRYLRYVPRSDSDDHGRLREHLKRSRRSGVSESLRKLRDWRNLADYTAKFEGDLAATAVKSLLEAQRVFDGLPQPSSPPS
jgi:hypothetical protein